MSFLHKSAFCISALFLGLPSVPAQDNHQTNMSITEKINASESIRITHPDALEERLIRQHSDDENGTSDNEVDRNIIRKSGGYRVQIFSDNNARTAKNEARTKARAIADAFPQYPTYVIFSSPYWRLKVGDFKTQEEAEVAATQIKRAFPAYAHEIRVVRDRINVTK